MLEPRNPPLGPLQLFQGSRKPSLGECSSTSCLCLLSQNCVGQGHHRHLPWEGVPKVPALPRRLGLQRATKLVGFRVKTSLLPCSPSFFSFPARSFVSPCCWCPPAPGIPLPDFPDFRGPRSDRITTKRCDFKRGSFPFIPSSAAPSGSCPGGIATAGQPPPLRGVSGRSPQPSTTTGGLSRGWISWFDPGSKLWRQKRVAPHGLGCTVATQPWLQVPGPQAGPTTPARSRGPGKASCLRPARGRSWRRAAPGRGGRVPGDCGVVPGACPLAVTSVTSR